MRTRGTRTPGRASHPKGRRHRCRRTILHTVPGPHGRSLLLSLPPLESTPGYWDPASANWRICPTSFGANQPARETTTPDAPSKTIAGPVSVSYLEELLAGAGVTPLLLQVIGLAHLVTTLAR